MSETRGHHVLGAGRTFCSPPTLAASVSACCLSVGISVSICIYLCRNLCKSLSVSSSVFQNLTSVSQLPCLPTSAQVFIPSTPPWPTPHPYMIHSHSLKGVQRTQRWWGIMYSCSLHIYCCVLLLHHHHLHNIFSFPRLDHSSPRGLNHRLVTRVCVSVCSLGACASNHCRKFWNTHRMLVHFLPYTGNGMAVFGIVWEQVSRGW